MAFVPFRVKRLSPLPPSPCHPSARLATSVGGRRRDSPVRLDASPRRSPARRRFGEPVGHQRFDSPRRFRVQGRSRFVQQQDRRVQLQRPQDRRDLRFPAGKVPRLFRQKRRLETKPMPAAERRRRDRTADRDCPGTRTADADCPRLCLRSTPAAAAIDDVPAELRHVTVSHRAAIPADFAGIHRIQHRQRPQQHRLAGTGRSRHRPTLAAADPQ